MTGPSNPNIEAIPIPIIIFITNVIPAIPQKAKKAHFFHINKKTVNATLSNDRTPNIIIAQEGIVGRNVVTKEPNTK